MATIDEVSMEDPDNILYFEGGSGTVNYLSALIRQAEAGHRPLRVTIDGGALKVKVGDESWSAPMRTERPHGGYHKSEEA